MDIGVLLVGDELTRGSRRDGHLNYTIDALQSRGMALSWASIVGDDADRIERMLRQSMASGDAVFSFGGIGCTPSDHVRPCAASAAGVALSRNPVALAEVEAAFGPHARPIRVQMADLPEGCSLIPNPVARCPGFSIRDHHFLPGIPTIARPMLDWVLDNHYRNWRSGVEPVEYTVHTCAALEEDLDPLVEGLLNRFPTLHFSSLPHRLATATDLEFGVRGPETDVRDGLDWLTEELNLRGWRWEMRRLYAM